MAKLPEPNHTTVARIYASYESQQEDPRRPHLGASLIGRQCERQLWYVFRWAMAKGHDGRLLRLFKAGQDFEPRIVQELRAIGVEVLDTAPDGKQWSVSALGGHFGGSMDGAALRLPEAPKTWHVLEFKTHNDKSFADLQKNGVRKAKPEHFSQMTVYMGLTGMERALYMAENKNTSELYEERIEFDTVEFARLMARAERVVTAAEPPLRTSNDPSFYVCKWCDYAEICHGNRAPDVNCRTCCHSTPMLDGERRWTCELYGDVDIETQRTSDQCPSHRYIPLMIQKAGTQSDTADVNGELQVIYTSETGEVWSQGPGGLSSLELRKMEDISMAADAARIKRELAAQGIDSKVVA
jgi:hypothetical protein